MGTVLSEHQKTFRKLVQAHIKKSGQVVRVLAVAGPNGGGKTTLIRALIKKFPKIFVEVIQVSTRPPRCDDRARRFVSLLKFKNEKIILGWIAGIYEYWYALQDLMSAIYTNKILIFEGVSRLEKLKKILQKKFIVSVIVWVLPPGRSVQNIVAVLEKRLSCRPTSQQSDIQKKLAEAQYRIIPEVLKKADLIIRSASFKTESDVQKVMNKIRCII